MSPFHCHNCDKTMYFDILILYKCRTNMYFQNQISVVCEIDGFQNRLSFTK